MFFAGDGRKTLWVVVPLVAALSGLMVDVSVPNGEDDVPPAVSIDSVTVGESDGTATFTITRKGKASEDTTVRVATSGIEATDGLDYAGKSTAITIPRGGQEKSYRFTVTIIDDAIDEPTEAFSVSLTSATDEIAVGPPGIGTIVDNDSAGITVDDGDGIFVLEGAAADTISVVLRSEPTAEVVITTTADPGQLRVRPEVVTFGPADWNTPQTIAITAVQDGMDEPDPHRVPVSFTVATADPNYSVLAPPELVATIGDADSLLVTIDGPAAGQPNQAATFTATVNAGGIGTITYDWTAFFLGNEIANGDQSVFRFTPAEAGSYNIQVIIGDDEGRNPATFIQFKALGDIGGSIFADDIVWMANEGITKGCNPPTNDLFCPNDIVTREQMAAFLVRALELTDNGGGNTFTDDNGSIFEDDIAKIATAGITSGCNPPTNDHFCPKDSVTREQMAAFLVRALNLADAGDGNVFVDDDGSIFEGDIAKIATAGITSGCNPPTNDHFCPTDSVTRGQMAALLRRAEAILNP